MTVDGRVERDPQWLVREGDRILVDGLPLVREPRVYLACNKPRGQVTTASDPEGRPTVYRCLEGMDFPHVGPVGRLDLESEGLLLFTNDTGWAAALLDPANKVPKTYHVRIDGILDAGAIERLTRGVVHDGETLRAKSVRTLRSDAAGSWIEVVLTQGKNREIRRMLEAAGRSVERLVRIRIGDLELGDLAKGAVRVLTEPEVEGLRRFGARRPVSRSTRLKKC